MDAVRRKVESQVQFWSLLGPFLVLLSIAVLLFKVSIHWYYPVSALIGIPLCVKWKMKGMAIALCSLLVLSGIGYQNLELDDRYWHVGLALAMAFSFIILTLSLEEVQGLVAKLQLESKSRLDNFSLLDEKLKAAEIEWANEREQYKAEATSLNLEIARAQEEKQTYYKLAQLSKEEIVHLKGQHEQVLQDFLYKKQQIAQLNERLEETELSLQAFVNSDHEKQILALSEQLSAFEREKEVLLAKVAVAEKEIKTSRDEKEQCSQAFKKCQESQIASLREQERSQHERAKLQQDFDALQKKLSAVAEERNALSQANAGKLSLQEHQLQLQAQNERHEKQIKQIYEQVSEESKQKQNRLEKEVGILQDRCQKANEDLFAAQQNLEFQNEGLVQLLQKENQGKEKIESLQRQLREQKEQFDEKFQTLSQQTEQRWRHEQQALETKIRSEQASVLKTQDELKEAKTELTAKSEALNALQSKLNLLAADLSEKQTAAEQAVQQSQNLQDLKVNLEALLQQTQAQLQAAEEKLNHYQQKRDKLPYAPGNTRHIEAMYLQLKEQFQDKCNVLDGTRRELFQAHEELLKRQKEYDEEKIFGESANERLMQRNLLQLGRQYDQMQQNYQQEVDELHQLVQQLLQQLRKE